MVTQAEVVSVEAKSCRDHIKQQLECGSVASCGDRANGSGESCVYVSAENGVSGGRVDKEGSEVELQTRSSGVVDGILTDVENANVDVDFPVANGIETKVESVDVLVEEVAKVNVEVHIKVVDDVNVGVGSPVTNGIETMVENIDVSVEEVQKVNVEVPIKVVDDVNVEADAPVANGIEITVENVDVSVEEAQKVNVEVLIKGVDDVNVVVDYPVVNGIETKVENADVSVKDVHNVNVEVEVDSLVVNGIATEFKDKDVDVSVEEGLNVSMEVDYPETKVENLLVSVKEVENVNVEVDSPVANRIPTEVEVESTKEGPCEIQPVELCNGKVDMVVVLESEMVGEKETGSEGLAIVEQELGIESEVVPIDSSKYVGSTPENESLERNIEAPELVSSTNGDQLANDIIEAHIEAMAPTSDVAVAYKKVLMNCFPSNKDVAGEIKWATSNIMFGTLNFRDIGDQQNGSTGVSGRNLLLEESEDTRKTNNTIAVDSPRSSRVGEVGEDQKVVTKPFNYLVKFPRADDGSLKEQINLRKLLVDKYTKLRDDIQVQIQETRKANNLNGIDYEYAKKELSALKNSERSKRMELNSLINKVKNVAFIKDIDQQVSDMERTIQHESIPLKEEKQIIQNIKQLKQRREALCPDVDSQEEIKKSLEQRETPDDRMKVLMKELDILRENIIKTEAVKSEAGMKYDVENEKVKELQARSRAANDSRQESYAQMQSLKKELYDKNKHFYKYKDCRSAATKHAHNKDTEGLHLTCKTQVENFMELWNADAEFRREYVTRNMKSNVRRLGTLDGRSLGPNEKRPIIPGEHVHKVASNHSNVDCVLGSQILETKQVRGSGDMSSTDKSKKKITQAKSQAAKLKAAAEPVLASVSGRDIPEETVDSNEEIELAKKSEEMIRKEAEDKLKEQRRLEELAKEEIELAKKAEELRRKEAEDKLKEQRRLEELAKANEAREKKKRQEEKEKRRAEVRAQKEAEQKEKEREKRLRKKEKKKALLTGSINSTDHSDAGQNFENAIETSEETEAKEMEIKEVSTAKKPKIPPVFTKKIKKRYVPPPPCIWNKRSWKNNPWVIKGICGIVIMLLVYMGIRCFKSEKPLW